MGDVTAAFLPSNYLQLTSITVAQLPKASKFPGSLALCSDVSGTATLSSAVASAATTTVNAIVWSNGTTWNVAAL